MFVKTLADVLGSDDHAIGEAYESRRLILARNGLGYSLHDTLIKAGTSQHLHYKNHIESNYCISGEGEVENEATGEVWPIRAGTLFVLDRHDAHIVRAKSEIRLICVFTPALTGHEKHDKDGSYAAPD
ncbi:MAG: ectoine synthase [Pseudomonadota bacterium]